jgi:hypothetical protein
MKKMNVKRRINMKYTADDILKALKHCIYEMPYEQYVEFKASLMGVDKEDLDALSEKGIFTLAEELGAEKFIDVYNEYLNNFKNTLHVGDVYNFVNHCKHDKLTRVIITEYDADKDYYYMLFDDGIFSWTTNDSFDFDNYEKIGSINTNTFIHSKNDLINKLNEL